MKRFGLVIMMLLLFSCLSILTGCGPKTRIIPDSRVIVDCPAHPGYKCLSEGYLRDILQTLDVCAGER